MTWIRTAWLLAVGLPVTAFYATWAVLASWVGIRYAPHNVYDRIMHDWAALLLRANGVTVSAEGLDRLDPARSYVFVANHTSIVDIWALLVALPHSFRFVAKTELERVPVFGRAMESAGNIFIDRGNLTASFASYDQAGARLREGLSAMVFAEGTRSRDGRLLPFKKGPFILAITAGVPLVPLYIDGAFERTPKGALNVRPGPVVVRVGNPIATVGLAYGDRDALGAAARAEMMRLGAR
jgi:1-acyl-sn-glycerol-3-phosphate acyltransferase